MGNERLNPPFSSGGPRAVPQSSTTKPRKPPEGDRGPVFSKQTVMVTKSVGITGTFPAVIVYVQPKAEWTRRFYRFLAEHYLSAVVYGDETPGTWSGTKRRKFARMGGPDVAAERAANATHDTTSVTGLRNAWEVVGSAEAIAALLEHDCVREWHGLIACSVRWSGQGNGAEKVKASRPREKDKRGADTRAVVTGNDRDEHGKRIATWEMRSVPPIRELAPDPFDYWTACETMENDGCPNTWQ